MRILKLLIASVTAAMLLFTYQSILLGDAVFSVEVDPPTNAGDTTNVTFSASSTVAGGETISGFNIPVDLAGGGNNDSGGIFTGATLENLVGGSSSINPAELQNTISGSDFIVNISNGAGILITTDTALFNLALTSSPSLGVGSYSVEISQQGLFSVTAADGTDLTDTSTVSTNPDGSQGSVNIVATIPEPSSFVILFGAFGLASLKRRRS